MEKDNNSMSEAKKILVSALASEQIAMTLGSLYAALKKAKFNDENAMKLTGIFFNYLLNNSIEKSKERKE